MKRLRAALRLITVAGFSAVCYVAVVLAGGALDLGRRLGVRARGSGRVRSRFFRFWARAVAAILGLRVTARGTPPRPPFVLVSNHLGYLDVVVLGAALDCVFVAKADVRRWPVAGRLCRAVDTLFIDRASKRDIPRVVRRIEEVLGDGRGVVVFPEGTSSGGDSVLPFRPSLLEIAARDRLPVSWAALSYRTAAGAPPARLSVCWWGDMPFGRHVLGLLGLPAIEATITWGERPIVESDRKLLAGRLREAVEREFRPVI